MLSGCIGNMKKQRLVQDVATQAVDAYMEEQRIRALAPTLVDMPECALNLPPIVWVEVPGSFRGHYYQPSHRVPVFVERARVLAECTGVKQ